jgi:hypothetical protein
MSLFDTLFGPKTPNRASSIPHYHPKTNQLIPRLLHHGKANLAVLFPRLLHHSKANLAVLFLTLFLFSLLGFALFDRPSKPPVLGQVTALPTADPANGFCLELGGRLDFDDDNRIICTFLDGTQCPVAILFQEGQCVSFDTPAPTRPHVSNQFSPPQAPQPTSIPLSVYYLVIVRKPDAPLPIESRLIDYVSRSLKLPRQTLIRKIVFDTRQGNPYRDQTAKFNFSYYLIVEGSLPTLGKFDNYATSFNLEVVNQSILPLLEESDYCHTDLDCMVRDDFCTYGAFNIYQTFLEQWACQGKVDEFGEALIFYDETQQCKAQTVFDEPACINNRCIPQQQASLCLPTN